MNQLTAKISNSLLGVAAGALMLYGLAAPVRANPCDPNSDCMFVFDGTGALVASTTVAEAVEDPNAVYTVPGIAIDPAQFGNATTLIEAGGNSATGPFSDIFGVASTGGGLFLAFSSDNEVTTPFGARARSFSRRRSRVPTTQQCIWTRCFGRRAGRLSSGRTYPNLPRSSCSARPSPVLA